MIRFFLLMVTIFMFTSCSTYYPLGLTQSEWNSLTPTQKANYKLKQYEIDKKTELELAKNKNYKPSYIYQNNYEKPVQVKPQKSYNKKESIKFVIYGGSYNFDRHWFNILPVTAVISRGELISLRLNLKRGSKRVSKKIWLYYDKYVSRVKIFTKRPTKNHLINSLDCLLVKDRFNWKHSSTYKRSHKNIISNLNFQISKEFSYHKSSKFNR